MKKILCIGSVNLDHVYQVSHIVTPGETIATNDYQTHWGGKGLNQALALAKAGAHAFLAARISDNDMEQLTLLGRENGLDTSCCQTCNVPTGHTIIQVDGKGQNCILFYAGANNTLDNNYISQVLNKFTDHDYLLLQNEVNNVPDIIRAAKKKGMKIILNPSPMPSSVSEWPLDMVDVLIFNEVEGALLSGSPENPDTILSILKKRYPETQLVLTLGSEGSRYLFKEEYYVQPICKTAVVDTTAAGDTFTGYFLSALSAGKSITECLSLAAKASSIAVSRPGAVDSIPFAHELQN